LSDNIIYLIDSTKILTQEMLDDPNNQINLGPTVSGSTYIDLYRDQNSYNQNKLINNIGYTSNFNDNSISVVDLNSKNKISDIKVGNNPVFLCVSEKNKLLFIANFGDNSVSCFSLDDPTNPSKLSDLEISDKNEFFNKPSCIEITPDENLIYIANSGSNKIHSFNISVNKKITFNQTITIPDSNNIFSIDFNNTQSIGVLTTDNGISLIQYNNESDDMIHILNDDSGNIENINKIQSARIRYSNCNDQPYYYIFIINKDGKLYRKKIKSLNNSITLNSNIGGFSTFRNNNFFEISDTNVSL